LMVVQGMMKTCDRVIIAICGGGQEEMFNAEEVRDMISAALLNESIMDAQIVVVDDCISDEDWVDKLLEVAERPADEVAIWSGKDDVLALADKAGIATKRITHVPGHDSAEIREMIKNKDRAWMTKVPGGANDVVMRHMNK